MAGGPNSNKNNSKTNQVNSKQNHSISTESHFKGLLPAPHGSFYVLHQMAVVPHVFFNVQLIMTNLSKTAENRQY